LRIGVYSVILAGWSSNSNYAFLGGLRAVAQTISYEVSLALILLSLIFLIGGYNFFYFLLLQKNIWFLILCFPLSLV
jgi:NADH-ubiquinone oxidoreductase chain 1